MKYCFNCGNKLKKGDKVCSECGTKLDTFKEEKVVKEAKIESETVKDEVKNEKKEDTSSLKGSYHNDNIKTSHVVNESSTDADTPIYLCIASLICTFILTPLMPFLKGLPLLIGLGLMVFVRISYPKSTFGKVLMWLYIILYVIAIIV